MSDIYPLAGDNRSTEEAKKAIKSIETGGVAFGTGVIQPWVSPRLMYFFPDKVAAIRVMRNGAYLLNTQFSIEGINIIPTGEYMYAGQENKLLPGGDRFLSLNLVGASLPINQAPDPGDTLTWFSLVLDNDPHTIEIWNLYPSSNVLAWAQTRVRIAYLVSADGFKQWIVQPSLANKT